MEEQEDDEQRPVGLIVIVEMAPGIVLVHPPSGTPEAPASLPGALLEEGYDNKESVVYLVRQQTGLEVAGVTEFFRFVQEDTPFGTVEMWAYKARATGGALRDDGPEGPAVAYSLSELPAIIPVRVANQRVLDAYLKERSPGMRG